jgi:hypothetical protein
VLFREHNRQTLEHLLSIALERGIKNSVTVYDDESELLIILKERLKRLGVEPILALVGKLSQRQERLNVDDHLLFGLAVVKEDDAAKQNESVVWGSFV